MHQHSPEETSRKISDPNMEHYTQVEFDDLNDGVGADDWLIPSQEITRRKLIKQTPRYKIFKADWFGDVLVYEPVRRGHSPDRPAGKQHGNIVSRRLEQHQKITQHELNSKFTELNLNLDQAAHQHQQHGHKLSPTAVSSQLSPSFSIDSAYSSISSTPQYHTKQVRSEFEFPSPSPSSLSSDFYWPQPTSTSTAMAETENHQCPRMNSIESLTSCNACNTDHHHHHDHNEEQHLRHHARPLKEERPECGPLVLNRDSFRVGLGPSAAAAKHQEERDENNNYSNYTSDNYDNAADYIDNCSSNLVEGGEEENTSDSNNNCCQISWFELNELRLVAHESFMLFMGASVDLMSPAQANDVGDQYASLVMQMSHPKAVSLFDLLHANNINNSSNMTTTCSSPLERFLARTTISRAQQQPSLSLESKLNICQQVTNAMTYLHDKNIVHGRLTSVNIYIELNQRVKISLIDNDERAIATLTGASSSLGQSTARSAPGANNTKSVSFNLPTLTYLSPEIIKTIKIGTTTTTTKSKQTTSRDGGDSNQEDETPLQVQIDTTKLTKSSDIYSFGTLLFELFEERYPFSGGSKQEFMPTGSRPGYRGDGLATPDFIFSHSQPTSPLVSKMQKKQWNGNIGKHASELIYQIGSGEIGTLNRSRGKCPSLVDNIISRCWSAQPCCRPQFKHLEFD